MLLFITPLVSAVQSEPVSAEGEEGEEAQIVNDINYDIYREEHPDNPCDRDNDRYDYEKKWYDHTQIYVNSRFCEPALWFDNFFASDRILDEGVAGTYVRWQNNFIYDEEDYFKFKTSLRASVQLPGISKYLRITFEGDEDDEIDEVAPGDTEDEQDRGNLGVQLELSETARSNFNVNVSFSPRIRFRYRYTYPVSERTTLRLTQEVQREKTTNSARTKFDYERLLYESFLFRSTTEAKFSEKYDGTDWTQAFVLFQRLDKKTSISYEGSVKVITEPVTEDIDYRVAVRFRKNFHRKWLFYEVTPEMTWPIDFDDDRTMIEQDRRSKWRISFRLEVHFGNIKKKKYK